MRRLCGGIFACVALVAGCDQGTHDLTSPDVGPSVGKLAAADVAKKGSFEQVHAVARLVSLALANHDVRSGVRDAMRISLLTEHKLVFHDFIRTPTGRLLVQEAARASGMSLATVQASLRDLPALDFYVPARAHRLRWRGDDRYFVGASVGGKAPSKVFDQSGNELAANVNDLAGGRAPLLMLQSAEQKSRRLRPQAAKPGLTIQDLDDGEISGTLTVTDAAGRSVTTDLAALPQAPIAALCTGKRCPPPPPPPDPPMRLRRIQTLNICDNANCSEGNEFEFKSTRPNGSFETLRIENIPSTTNMARADVMISTNPTIVSPISVSVKETDITSGDDNFAYVTYNPNYVGPARVMATDNLASWPMKETPHVAVTDLYTLGVQFGW